MKTIVHKSETRGHANHGWLNSYHTFSFAGYFDPNRVQFGALRVLNDDTVAAGAGFGTHPHDNMEIVSIPLKGKLTHQDSTGNTETVTPGMVQIMSAGTGIHHSEYNGSSEEEVKFLQIWVLPKERNIEPRYADMNYELKENEITTIVAPDQEQALWINQDAYFSIAKLSGDVDLNYKVKKAGHGLYAFVLEGTAKIAEESLSERDAVGVTEADNVSITGNGKVLLIEVPFEN